MRKWHVQENRVTTIHEMLKSKIFSDEKLMDNENGTPQGGVISPMLANVALTGFDENCHEKFGWNCNTKEGRYKVSPLVRYADDFIIISPTAKEAEHIKAEIDEHLKRNVGLRLSEEKTRIVNINEGFSFLGFNIRKDNNKLLIQPQVEKTQKVKQKLSETIRACKGASQATVIEKLNPIITGWGNYYRNAVSQETFDKVDYEIYLKLNQWTKKKHPNKTKAWSLRRYFHQVNGRKWVFKDKQNQKKLARMSEIPIKRHIKVKKGYRVYDKSEDAREYWEKREYMNAKESIYGSGEYLLLFKKQKGKCAQCKNPITQEHIQNVEIHKHHMKPRSTGGNRKISNLRLLHTECHQIIHSKWTRKEMAKMVDNGIDYLLLLKPQPTVTGIDGESRMR